MDILRQSSNTRENLSLLSVMEALEEDKHITQRELAQATGLNLKKVNYCLHKLLEKGHIKFQRARQNPNKRAYLYILTPAGLKAKTKLTYDFLKFSLDFYSRMEDRLYQCLAEMADAGVRRVLLYGASDVVRILQGFAKRPQVVGVIDIDYSGQEFHGIPVVAEHAFWEVKWDGILITALDSVEENETYLKQLGVPEHAIWKLS